MLWNWFRSRCDAWRTGPFAKRALKLGVCAFILLNVLAVTRAHLSPEFSPKLAVKIYKMHPKLERAFTYTDWLVGYYAYVVGLDNRWAMFSYFHRDDWWFTFVGDYGREQRTLPLPLQSERTFAQKYFFDFKEVKFHLNLYNRPHEQRSYAYFLCRKFPEFHGEKIKSIKIHRSFRAILEPDLALRFGYHMAPTVRKELRDTVLCPV